MDNEETHTYISINDKTETSRILFVSRAVKDALHIDPQSMVGTSAYTSLYDPSNLHFSCKIDGNSPDAGMVMMYLNLKDQRNNPIYARVILVNCGDCMFSIAKTFPDRDPMQINHFIVNRVDASTGNVLPFTEHSQAERRRKANVYTMPAPQMKACFVIGGKRESNGCWTGLNGPEIVFVTNSISSLIDVDGGYEVIGVPFLSIIAPHDIVKVASYLERLMENEEPAIARFSLRKSIQSASHSGSRDEPSDDQQQYIEVEALGAGSYDGTIILCRSIHSHTASNNIQHRARHRRGARAHDSTESDLSSPGYLSFEDIISSDPDTSDCPAEWNIFA